MIAILLAAGRGTRLLPLTAHTPKSLLPLGAMPLLHRTLESFGGGRIDTCVIVTGFCAPQIEAAVSPLHLSYPIRFVHNARFAETNNNYSLWLAMTEARGHDVLVLDSDILFASAILDRLLIHPSRNALVIRSSVAIGEEEIKVETDERGCVCRIGKEIDPATAAGESIGMEKFSADAAQDLLAILARRKERDEFYEASFQEFIDRGGCLSAVDAGELPCIEIDTPEDHASALVVARTLDEAEGR